MLLSRSFSGTAVKVVENATINENKIYLWKIQVFCFILLLRKIKYKLSHPCLVRMCSSGPDPQPVEGAGSLDWLEGVLIRLAAVGSATALPDPAPGWDAQVSLAFLGRNLLKDFYGLLF